VKNTATCLTYPIEEYPSLAYGISIMGHSIFQPNYVSTVPS